MVFSIKTICTTAIRLFDICKFNNNSKDSTVIITKTNICD